MSTDHDPLTDAELDQLATLDAARTPGLLTAVSPRSEEGGQAIAHTGGCREGSEHATSIRLLARGERDFIPTTQEQAEADARAIAAALNALPALLAEVRASRAAAVEVRAVATALAEHEPCLACDGEDQQDSCLYHESHELSARLLAALGVAK